MAAGTGVELGAGFRLMAGVGTGVGGYAVVEALDEGLHVVVPTGGIGRGLHAGDEHGAQVVVFEEFLLLIGEVAGRRTRLFVGFPVVMGGRVTGSFFHRDGLVGTVEHQTGNLFHRQLRGKVGSAFAAWQAPVFVGVEGVVAVEVFERIAVDGKDFHSGLGRIAQGGTSTLFHYHKGVDLLFRPFLSSAGAEGCRYHKGGKGVSCCHVFQFMFVSMQK